MRTIHHISVETNKGHHISLVAEDDGSLIITVRGGEPLGPREQILLLEAMGRDLENGGEGTDHVDVMTTAELHERLNRGYEGAPLSSRAMEAIREVAQGPYIGNLVQVKPTGNCSSGGTAAGAR